MIPDQSNLTIFLLINIISSQAKNVYEKVGEATETALTVLTEKVNCLGIDKAGLKKKELGTYVNHQLQVCGYLCVYLMPVVQKLTSCDN